jgi:hypothetical protein
MPAGLTILSQGVGYGVVLGVGAFFALGMMFITWSLRRYNNELQTSEVFSTAGRSVKSGLVAAAVVSNNRTQIAYTSPCVEGCHVYL